MAVLTVVVEEDVGGIMEKDSGVEDGITDVDSDGVVVEVRYEGDVEEAGAFVEAIVWLLDGLTMVTVVITVVVVVCVSKTRIEVQVPGTVAVV